ncbi:MAG: SMC-Scp complex subunit ScpB [archaeon]|nr:SMC-Scp complex subunit ScpB [archaeon]MCR4324026.1 SMC-Scp complex subunit ScpB [Nanoarchaeota archaeon]
MEEEKIITGATAEEIETEFEEKEKESLEKVEAALFISGRFLELQELIMLTDVNPIMLREVLSRLEKKYSSGVLRLVNRGSSWKMDVAEKYNYLINKLATGSVEFTKSEQETLAIIAKKQPIKQSVLIRIRGNKSYDHIRKFRELRLVVAKKAGRTFDLSLSDEFYDYFNVASPEYVEKSAEKQRNERDPLKKKVEGEE